MRFSTIAMALASVSSASAAIYAITVPAVLTPNTTFPLTFNSNLDATNSLDVAVAYGFGAPPPYAGALGFNFKTIYLAGEESGYKMGTNYTVDVVAPAAIAGYNGSVVVTAAVYQIFGYSGTYFLKTFNVTVDVGDASPDDGVVFNGDGDNKATCNL
ncbi:hypothetical protein COCCADRAFT_35713 [Bipolaris zeicola 26-R-13]|uniref:Uncharacterized protein n=1 Tax=Cochliobolus carbonum (strain 26-R-13) TaxID=930089 RepID=W6YT67_COCC2|nr:uncharacterized protein COCCADRAFT_35713 [Bipolaris zeicola 26-R-13]EUC34676.1 hypothetical protein COCCADRAFT_35713 [Bipolaris zeicola 26-R-13]